MKVIFYAGFNKDLDKTKDKKLALLVLQTIQLFQRAKKLEEIPNVKKLKGHPNAYRYRKGNYRIGFFVENDTLIFAAFAPRGKIYRKFP